jgi:DNA-binding MarR family transcriptional regulator
VDDERGIGLNLDVCDAHREPTLPSDVNWLLHRAAQRFGDALEVEAKRHGVGLRGQLVLSALVIESGRTQLALGADLSLDKTTLTTVLDKLERDGLVRRRPDPADRRVRIPEVTEAGVALQRTVASAIGEVESDMLGCLDTGEQKALEAALRRVIDHDPGGGLGRGGVHRPGGSCM